MDELKDFRKTAIMLIYPNGIVKKVLIDLRLIHLRYFVDLYNEDEYFKKIVDKNDIPVPSNFWTSNMVATHEIDKALASIGIIAFRNLYIYETINKDDFIENMPPCFSITLPCNLTNEQCFVLNDLCSNYDMSCSFYGMYMDYDLEDISYDEFIHILNSKKK